MAKECFCGCGLDVPFGRKRVANALGARVDKDVRLFRSALERSDQGEHEAELGELVATGEPLRDRLRDVVHGTLDRKDFDRAAGRAWLERANGQRGRMAMEIAKADFAGWNAHAQAELVYAGAHAPAVVLSVRDTGMTINEDPRVLVRLRVTPDGEAPFEVERKVVVSRVAVPRAGERVEVSYDPADRSRFTFRMTDLSDDATAAAAAGAPPDRLAQLERLGELRSTGVLTDEEFAAEKARILGA